MLQNGASKVYAIDVGYGQLAWKLRTDERVINLERTNFRYVTREQIPDELDFASVDVSFISLSLILPVMRTLLKDGGQAVCLIKPQFEAGKENVGKKGVVRDKNVHIAVIEKIVNLIAENNFTLLGLDFSPVKGPEGNIEYLCHIKKSDNPQNLCKIEPSEVVEQSYKALKEG
jgi:23S rRNA (cytidine1920-2'-O)/16S rRNA (cytidine1409-2'-O)-methyltransferase